MGKQKDRVLRYVDMFIVMISKVAIIDFLFFIANFNLSLIG
jgi:hypothetical protein